MSPNFYGDITPLTDEECRRGKDALRATRGVLAAAAAVRPRDVPPLVAPAPEDEDPF
jgi:hypothetical protein